MTSQSTSSETVEGCFCLGEPNSSAFVRKLLQERVWFGDSSHHLDSAFPELDLSSPSRILERAKSDRSFSDKLCVVPKPADERTFQVWTYSCLSRLAACPQAGLTARYVSLDDKSVSVTIQNESRCETHSV